MGDTKDIEAQRRLFEHYKAIDESYTIGLEFQALDGDLDVENPELLPNGMLSKWGLTSAKIAAIESKKERTDLLEFLIFLQAIEDATVRLNEIIDELEERMAER